jgi:hypothetical protein
MTIAGGGREEQHQWEHADEQRGCRLARWTPVWRTRRWHGVVVDGGTAARRSGD